MICWVPKSGQRKQTVSSSSSSPDPAVSCAPLHERKSCKRITTRSPRVARLRVQPMHTSSLLHHHRHNHLIFFFHFFPSPTNLIGVSLTFVHLTTQLTFYTISIEKFCPAYDIDKTSSQPVVCHDNAPVAHTIEWGQL